MEVKYLCKVIQVASGGANHSFETVLDYIRCIILVGEWEQVNERMKLIFYFLRHLSVLKMKKLELYNYVQDPTHGKLMTLVILEVDNL